VAKEVGGEWVGMEAGDKQFDKGDVVSLGQHDASGGGGPRCDGADMGVPYPEHLLRDPPA
jgi:hypothetical protein